MYGNIPQNVPLEINVKDRTGLKTIKKGPQEDRDGQQAGQSYVFSTQADIY